MSTITIGNRDEYQIIEKTQVNGRKIIQLMIGTCKHHFYESMRDIHFKYILLSRNLIKNYDVNSFILIGIHQDIDDTDPAYIELKENINKSGTVIDKINKKYNVKRLNVDHILKNTPGCETPLQDLREAHQIIQMLNNIIERECYDLRLQLDYVYNMSNRVVSFSGAPSEYLLLCLYYKENCISSIEIIKKQENLKINSKTDSEYENKKYNKLLRAATIIISRALMPEGHYLHSVALNPISAWLLINTFNGVIRPERDNDEWFNFIEENYKDDHSSGKITNKMIRQFYDDYTLIEVDVELNDENIHNAMTKFHEIVGVMGCDRKSLQDEERNANPTGGKTKRKWKHKRTNKRRRTSKKKIEKIN